MSPNSAMWGREAKFVCGDEEKGEFYEFFENFVSFLVDRSKLFIEMRSAEVGDMIYSTLLLSPASEIRPPPPPPLLLPPSPILLEDRLHDSNVYI